MKRVKLRNALMKMSTLDFKLGFRLLLRYPGLTIVGSLAMAFAIAVGAGAFEVVKQVVDPKLPLDDGDRVVAVRMRNLTTNDYRDPTLRELVSMRDSLTTVEQLGAFRTLERNLSVAGGVPEPVQLAEMSAAGFRIARVAPLLGRLLIEADELPGAPPVMVLGHELWQQRFAADVNVIGREVRIGSVYTTVVGVMPKGFAFPISHRLWLPLRVDQSAVSNETAVQIFGRLARGATIETAQAELLARPELSIDRNRQPIQPVVEPYTLAFGISIDLPPALRPLLYAINVFFLTLLLLICANVALLIFARAATRESEIVVRTALGAGRSRIMTQLFAEALALGAVAALIGLGVALFALDAFRRVAEIETEGKLPFWFLARLSPATVLYTIALTLIAAGVAGVMPALKMTGPKVDAKLRRLAAGGGGLRFGGLWTAVIIAQVTLTVAFPAGAFFVRRSVVDTRTMDVGFAAEQYLSARLESDRLTGFYATTRELTRRLAVEAGVANVTLTDHLPHTPHQPRVMEMEAGAGANPDTPPHHRVAEASVDLNYFDALGARILAGRAFHSGDRSPNARTVIVNESFVQRVLAGRNPIGRRIRYVDDVVAGRQPWYEIVGVVKDLGMGGPGDPGLYHAMSDDVFPIYLAIELRQDPASFGPRLRALAASVDPELRLDSVLPLTDAGASMWSEFEFLFKLLAGVSGVALALSLAGIYAATSFTVARRTREIGIRVALGADSPRIVAAILARPVMHVGIGILAGASITAALSYGVMRGALGLRGGAVIVGYAVLMMSVCLLACVVPTRRALRVQPTEALRQD
jgi:putative ABC transport system permease protein